MVRPRSAKPLFIGSNPIGTSKKLSFFGARVFLSKPTDLVYHQMRWAAFVSHHNVCVYQNNCRLDDIQNFVLMICNSCGIDDIQCFALIYRRFYVIIHLRGDMMNLFSKIFFPEFINARASFKIFISCCFVLIDAYISARLEMIVCFKSLAWDCNSVMAFNDNPKVRKTSTSLIWSICSFEYCRRWEKGVVMLWMIPFSS